MVMSIPFKFFTDHLLMTDRVMMAGKIGSLLLERKDAPTYRLTKKKTNNKNDKKTKKQFANLVCVCFCLFKTSPLYIGKTLGTFRKPDMIKNTQSAGNFEIYNEDMMGIIYFDIKIFLGVRIFSTKPGLFLGLLCFFL